MGNHLGGDAGATFGKTYWTLSHNIYSVNTIPYYALLFILKLIGLLWVYFCIKIQFWIYIELLVMKLSGLFKIMRTR